MKKSHKGFIALPVIIILALLIAGGTTAGIVIHQKAEKEKMNTSGQTVETITSESETKTTVEIKPENFNCKKDLCVESGKLNVGIYQTEYKVDIAQYKLTNGADKAISIDTLIFTHPTSNNFNGLLSTNFVLNVNGKQVGSAPAFVNRDDHYDLSFIKGNGQFDSFTMAPHETVDLALLNSVSPFSKGGNVEIFLSKIKASDNIEFSGNISGGSIPVEAIIKDSACQKKFGTMKNPSTGQIQPIRVHLLSPNTGKYKQGDTITIKWETCDLPVDGQLFRAYLGGKIIISEGPEAVNDGIQTIKIPSDLPDGNYSISIEVLDMYHGGGDYITFDDSDGMITVGNAPVDVHNDAPTPESENTTDMTDAELEARAKGNLSSFRAAAEITFDQKYGSYSGVCDSGNIAYDLFKKARQDLGMSKDNSCKENGTNYRVWVEMLTTSSVFCVDNTGHNDLVSKSSVTNNSYRCTQ